MNLQSRSHRQGEEGRKDRGGKFQEFNYFTWYSRVLQLVCRLIVVCSGNVVTYKVNVNYVFLCFVNQLNVLLTCIVIYPYNMNQKDALFTFNLFN
jgi:hypothetical protein